MPIRNRHYTHTLKDSVIYEYMDDVVLCKCIYKCIQYPSVNVFLVGHPFHAHPSLLTNISVTY